MIITDIRCTLKNGALAILHDSRGLSSESILQGFMGEQILRFECMGKVALLRTADVAAVEISHHELPKNIPMGR